MNSGELARFIHQRYWEISKEEGLITKKTTQLDFNDLPEEFIETILRMAEEIIEKIEVKKPKISVNYP